MRGLMVALILLVVAAAVFVVLWSMAFVGFFFVAPAHAHVQGPAPAAFVVPLEARRWQRAIIGDARYYFGLDVDYSVFFAQITQESRWNPNARSRVGALGLAQFMPATAAGMQRQSSALRQLCQDAGGCPYEPRWAIKAMVAMDRDLWRMASYATSEDDRWGFALSFYNGGPGWGVKERRACSGGVPMSLNRSSRPGDLDRTVIAAQRPVPYQAAGVGLGYEMANKPLSEVRCDPNRWFEHVERFCLRAAWACKENREYPKVILYRWRPLYVGWLRR